MNDMIINPTRAPGENVIPTNGLLFVNPSEFAIAMRLGRGMQGQTQRLYNSNLMVIQGDQRKRQGCFVAGPAVGAPMAVLTLEKLIALGAQRIIVQGWCGAIDREVQKEDIIIPLMGKSGEGTSRYYPLATTPETSISIRGNIKKICTGEKWRWHEGIIWTTDAPYRESREQVTELQKDKVLAVDMEFTALLQVAAFRKIELAAMFLVSDELWRARWQPSFTTKTFKHKSKRAVQMLIEMATAF